MHKKAVILLSAAVSVAAVATTIPEIKKTAAEAIPVAAVTQAAAPVPTPAVQAAPAPSPAVASAVARWRSLRQSDRLPFGAYASFLASHQGWPGESAMRRAAERAIGDSTPAAEIMSYFRSMPPSTGEGRARYAIALHASGRAEDAQVQAREAWRSGALSQPAEDRLLSLFSASLTPADHERRLDALLDQGEVAAAVRTLGFYAGAKRPVFETRLALQTQAADAASRVAGLGAAADQDAGLLIDRAAWLRNTGQPAAARALLAQPRTLTGRPSDAEHFYEVLLTMARGAENDGQWSLAYQIASQIDDAYDPGTDVSTRSYGERDDYTSLAWLAGTTALHRLNRPADAEGMFRRYANGSRSPQTQAKGYYWAGRAALQAGQAQRANGYFEQAAVHQDQYYGQLAMERLGRSLAAPTATPHGAPAIAARDAFNRDGLVQAIRYLGQTGQRADQSLFVRALAEQSTSADSRALAGELAREVGRPDLGVWIAREARGDGVTYYARASFPQVQIPPVYSNHWTLAHAIMRQESSFDRTALSHAGARGMMQLMPGTARETAGKLGMSYDLGRLTGDPGYNIMLGSKYFSDLMDRYGNFAPLAVAAYNAGPGNVNKWLRANGDPRTPGVDVVRWIEDIPFFETRNYVQRVLENAVVYETMNPSPQAPAQYRLSYYLGKTNRPG